MLRLRDFPETFAAACRINCLSMITEAGAGHIGACFSSMDILVWLALKELQPDDVVILSRGHEVPAWYAIQHGLGNLSDEALHTLRKPGGLPGHPDVTVPDADGKPLPGIICNTGSLGMGISKAKGMILADRLLGVKRRYFVLVGDGELQEGQIWEATYRAYFQDEGLLTVIVDWNGYQSDGRTPELDIGPTQDVYDTLGWEIAAGDIDGHSLTALRQAFHTFHGYEQPRLLIAQTLKGKGVSFMEGNPRWHSGAPNEEEYKLAFGLLQTNLHVLWITDHASDECPCDRSISVAHTWFPFKEPDPLIAAYSEALCEMAELNDRIIVLDADLTKDCGLLAFRERFPDRFIECGIAEQDMVSMASGLALRGFIPICHSFAAFLTRRALDQVYNQVSEGTRVIYVGSMAGKLPDNGPGLSHYSGYDSWDSLLMNGAGCQVFEPRTSVQVHRVLVQAIDGRAAPSVYIRLCTQAELSS